MRSTLVLILILSFVGIGAWGLYCSDRQSSPPGEGLVKRPDRSRRQRVMTVAAASDLKFVLDEIITEFHQRQPEIQVEVTYGSSGNLFAQLSNHAPFDIFFSANVEYPRKLIEKGLAAQQTQFMYGRGRIVVWARRDGAVDPEKSGIQTILGPSVRKVAIANPQHAPYGRAAEAALKNLGVYDSVRDKLVYGENIAQTTQFVQAGAADAGIIAYSLAVSPGLRQEGRFWEIPPDSYPALEQGGVILSWAEDWPAAQEFRGFVLSADGQAILRRYGLLPQEE